MGQRREEWEEGERGREYSQLHGEREGKGEREGEGGWGAVITLSFQALEVEKEEKRKISCCLK